MLYIYPTTWGAIVELPWDVYLFILDLLLCNYTQTQTAAFRCHFFQSSRLVTRASFLSARLPYASASARDASVLAFSASWAKMRSMALFQTS